MAETPEPTPAVTWTVKSETAGGSWWSYTFTDRAEALEHLAGALKAAGHEERRVADEVRLVDQRRSILRIIPDPDLKGSVTFEEVRDGGSRR